MPKRTEYERFGPGVKQTRGNASGGSDHSKESIQVGYNPSENPTLQLQSDSVKNGTGSFMYNPKNSQSDPQLKHARSFASNTNDGQAQQELGNAPSIELNNSWAKNSWSSGRSSNLHNSWVTTSAHPSAMISPLSMNEHITNERSNSVPAPPAGFRDYQPTTLISHELGFVEQKLHFHVNTIYEGLRRLIIDGNDRVIDEVIKRTDKIEERVDKSFRGTSRHFHEVQEEVKVTLDRAIKETQLFNPMSQETLVKINNMENNMTGLGNGVQHIGTNMGQIKDRISNLQDRVANLGDQMLGLTMQVNGALSAPRITSTGSSGSAHPPNRRESIQSHNVGRNRGSSQRREGTTTPVTPRRSTGNQQQGLRRFNSSMDANEGQRGQYADTRREPYADNLGRVPLPEPDLALHPAYATNQQEFTPTSPAKSALMPPDEDGDDTLFPKPSFVNGSWFTHAHSED